MSYITVEAFAIDSSNQKAHTVQLRDLLTGFVKTNDSTQYLLLGNPKKNIIIHNSHPLTKDFKSIESLWMSKKEVLELENETVYSILSDEDLDEIQIPVFEDNGSNTTPCMLITISKAILLDLDIVNGNNYLDIPLMGFKECLCLIKGVGNVIQSHTFKTTDIDRLMSTLNLLIVNDNHHCITESSEINVSDYHLPIINYFYKEVSRKK